MKTFNYIARDNSGALRRGSVQADDRAGALREIQRQALISISVTEEPVTSNVRRKFMLPATVVRPAAVVMVLVVLGLLTLVFMPKRKSVDTAAAGGKETAVVKAGPVPAVKKQAPVPPPAVERPDVEVSAISEPVPVPAPPPPAAAPLTNVASAAAAPKRISAMLTKSGLATNQPPSGYSSGAERLLNMFVNTRKGMPPPPLVNITPGADLQKILNTDISVYEEDSDLTIEQKANVAQAKAMLKQYLAAGGTAETFLQEYHKELKQAAETRKAAQRQMSELVKAGDLEGARRYMDEQNKALGAEGITPLQPHPAMLQK